MHRALALAPEDASEISAFDQCRWGLFIDNDIFPVQQRLPAGALAVYREDVAALCSVVSDDRVKPSAGKEAPGRTPATHGEGKQKTVNDYFDLIMEVGTSEYLRSGTDSAELDEIVDIGALALHTLLTANPNAEFKDAYLATAIRWAIRNELKHRYGDEWSCLSEINSRPK